MATEHQNEASLWTLGVGHRGSILYEKPLSSLPKRFNIKSKTADPEGITDVRGKQL